MAFYCLRQFPRIDAVYHIRINWIRNLDDRHSKYSYDEMLKPNKQNRCGLKIPEDTDFK